MCVYVCQCYGRDRDMLDSIDDSQQSLNEMFGVGAVQQTTTDCLLINTTDSDDSPAWDPRLPIPSLFTRPLISNSPSPELKYYKRKAF